MKHDNKISKTVKIWELLIISWIAIPIVEIFHFSIKFFIKRFKFNFEVTHNSSKSTFKNFNILHYYEAFTQL